MAFCAAGPTLLKAWVEWLKGGFLLRLLGVPAALLAVHLELYGHSPAATSRILRRLSRRLRLVTIACTLGKGNARGLKSLSFPQSKEDQVSELPPATPGSRPRLLSKASCPSTPITPAYSSPRPSMPSHSRSMSHADVLQRGKRLSLQFPIQLAAGSSSPGFSPRSRPQSWVATPSSATTFDTATSPTESNILAILAAQDRYVLELKEELAKAEGDLKILKKHWATHEAVKLRNDARRVTQLQPLNTNLANFRADQEDEDGSTAWMQKEMERRKALLSGMKTSQRKVFSGSKHLRTLSLLSPDKSYSPSFPQPFDLLESAEEPAKRPEPLTRATTSPDFARHTPTNFGGERYDLAGLPNIQRDALLRTGKQMATDFKDGLLTFFDDIRQATVGEEGDDDVDSASIRGPAPRSTRKPSNGQPALNRAASSASPKETSAQKTAGVGDEFWKEHGLSEPKTAPTNKKTHTIKNTRTPQKLTQTATDDLEDWDSWDTPEKRLATAADATSSDESDGPSSPVSGQNSSRTSTRYHAQRHDSKASSLTTSSSAGLPEDVLRDPKRNSIPWPDLVKLSPTNLKRTASHLMKEWEKNMTPPAEAREANHASGDYIGRSGSPGDLI
ncbi:hypothetical protein BDV95DRAFT_494422 [Massariosphaeria phaeospora]|uniref:DUF4048 domain-containing protein n=1 Tax=Massariosphaeria phaeospora TaxID=100035 RepID=A0A7C8M805_9PLEO|nr:hypothetical protein BDV95DRAFT_494422 [Massariosphaeria phaeospora]